MAEIPVRVLTAITDEDRHWVQESHTPAQFHEYRKRHTEIHREIEHAEGVNQRGPPVREAAALLDDLERVRR